MTNRKLTLQAFQFFYLLTLISGLIFFSGCSDTITNSGTATVDSSKGYTEKEFVSDPNLKAKEGAVIVDDLEDLNSPIVSEDTGPVGEDIIGIHYNETGLRKYRVGDSSAVRLKLVENTFGLTVVDISPGQRASLTVLAGDYTIHLISLQEYSAADTSSTKMIFMHPDSYTEGPVKFNTVIERGICISCNLSLMDMNHFNLKNAFLDSSTFRNINLIHTDFTGGSISHCRFIECFMHYGVYFKTHFHYTYIGNCILDYAIFQESVGFNSILYNIKSARLTEFRDAILTDGQIIGSDFRGTYLEVANLERVLFDNVTFDSVKCPDANLKNARFINTSFARSNFSGVNFENGRIDDNLTLTRVNIEDANMCGLDKTRITAQNLFYNQYTRCWP